MADLNYLTLGGLQVYINDYLNGCDLIPPRKPLKKYKQRTLKRWAKDPKHYSLPQYWKMDGVIWCNTRSYIALRRSVNG